MQMRKGGMDRFMLDHLQELVVILHHDVPVIEICVELCKAKAHWQTLLFNICAASLNTG